MACTSVSGDVATTSEIPVVQSMTSTPSSIPIVTSSPTPVTPTPTPTKLLLPEGAIAQFECGIIEDQSVPYLHAAEISYSPDGALLIGVSPSRIDICSVAALKLQTTIIREWWSGVTWSPDGKQLTGVSEGKVVFWDVNSGEELTVIEPVKEIVENVAWSPNEEKLFTVEESYYIRNAITGEVIATPMGSPSTTYAYDPLEWSIDGNRVAGGSSRGSVLIWDVLTGKKLAYIEYVYLPAGGVDSIAWSPDGKQIAIGFGRLIVTHDSVTGKTLIAIASENHGFIGPFPGDELAPITVESGKYVAGSDIVWSPDGKWLAGGSGTGLVAIYDPYTGETILTLDNLGYVYGVDWSPDGKVLATWSEKYGILLWDMSQLLPDSNE